MTRNIFFSVIIISLLASCGSMKPSASKSGPLATKPVATKPAETQKNDLRFLDQITVNNPVSGSEPEADVKPTVVSASNITKSIDNTVSSESVSELQTRYAKLLETEPELIQNIDLLRSIDYWYGTRYRMGGTSKSGVDCSAFVQSVYLAAFAMVIPRTAFEQFKVSNRVSAVEMKEGDLVFFNTTGGVSHVGIYLRNNKFVHASSAKGVTISDLFEPYYLKRFLGIGRIEKPVSNR